MNFRLLFMLLYAAAFLSGIYFWTRFHRFSLFQRMAKKSRILSWIAALVPVLVIGVIAYLDAITMVVVILHLFVIWLLCDLFSMIIQKMAHKRWKRYWQGAAAIVITFLYLCAGWYYAHHVFETDYTLAASKNAGIDRIRVVQIADSHLGATFDGNGFAKHLDTIAKTDPDLLVITGDFVDDDTKKEDLLIACEALGKMKTRYGIYYVYGNHDKGYFRYRDFSADDLVTALEDNHVTILEDDITEIEENIVLIGRQDRSTRSRADMKTLMKDIEPKQYTIVLDHQPNDYAAQAESGADLVLSGHTHGGWLFPMGIISQWIGPDDRVYGMEKRNQTSFIVTSGISDWALPFKTGTIAEFVVIDITFGNSDNN